MRGFNQSSKFLGRNQSNFLIPFAPYDHNFMIVSYTVKDRRKPLSQIRVAGFCHKLNVQVSCTCFKDSFTIRMCQ